MRMSSWVVSQKFQAFVPYGTEAFFIFHLPLNDLNEKENKKMKRFMRVLAAMMIAAMMFALTGCGAGEKSGDTLKAVVIKQLDHASLDEIASAIEASLKEEAKKAGKEIKIEVVSGQNDSTVLKQLSEQAVSEGADVIVAIATLAAQIAAGSAKGTGIPVVYAAVSDPEGAGLTGLENVTGTSDALNTAFILDMMFALDTKPGKVGLLYSLSETNSEKPISEAKEILQQKGVEFTEATAESPDEVRAAVSLLVSNGVDAVFTPTDNVIMASELAIYQDLIDAGIPHFTGADSFVRNGGFTTCGVNYTDLGTRTGEYAFRAAVQGTEGMEDFYLMDGGIITVNTETASALGIDYSVFAEMGELVEVVTTED